MSLHANTIRDAEEAIRGRFAAEGFKGTLKYSPEGIIETDRWWYIPMRWIGCNGFIVRKSDLYVNWLGSAVTSLEDCIWGHDHGVFCDIVDFEFAPDTDKALAGRLLDRFCHMRPNARGAMPCRPVPYRESEVPDALARYFPRFKRHFAWYAIPVLRRASEQEGLRFSCELAAGDG